MSKHNFYLRSLEKPNPGQWYSTQVVGLNTLKKTIGELAKLGNCDGFFTNHSLRRSSTTGLFQAGLPKKLIKEFTGHRSDALDKYEITSEDQRATISNVISGNNCINVEEKENESEQSNEMQVVVSDKSHDTLQAIACMCSKKMVKMHETPQVAELLTSLLEARKGEKAKIKIEIEFS